MVSIIAPARDLSRCRVRKVGGQKYYRLHHDLKIYSQSVDTNQYAEVKSAPGILYLVALDGGDITVIKDDTLLAVDFDDWKEAEQFCNLGPYKNGSVQTIGGHSDP